MATGQKNTATFLFTVNTDKYIVNLNDDNYKPLSTVLGLTRIDDSNLDAAEGAIKLTAIDGVKNGVLFPVQIKYEAKGKRTKTGKQVFSTAKLFVPANRLEQAVSPTTGIVKQKYRGGSIVQVRGVLQRLVSI